MDKETSDRLDAIDAAIENLRVCIGRALQEVVYRDLDEIKSMVRSKS